MHNLFCKNENDNLNRSVHKFWNSYIGVFHPGALPIDVGLHEVHVPLVQDFASLVHAVNKEESEWFIFDEQHTFGVYNQTIVLVCNGVLNSVKQL